MTEQQITQLIEACEHDFQEIEGQGMTCIHCAAFLGNPLEDLEKFEECETKLSPSSTAGFLD